MLTNVVSKLKVNGAVIRLLSSDAFMNGSARGYTERMYRLWKIDPKAVHASWDAYFEALDAGEDSTQAFQIPGSVVPPISSAVEKALNTVVPSIDKAPTTAPPSPSTSPSVDEVSSPGLLSAVTCRFCATVPPSSHSRHIWGGRPFVPFLMCTIFQTVSFIYFVISSLLRS
eukprot:Trichotokara_eunicae@DN1565_c0_g1_i1.p1